MEKYELCHWGIKGMKWGVRRYQNKDGSLTPAGRKRQKNWSEDAKAVSSLRNKKINEMSNAELRKLNERVQLENQYRSLNPSAVKKGMKFVAGAVAITGTILNLRTNGGRMADLAKEGAKAAATIYGLVSGKTLMSELADSLDKFSV